MLTKTMKWVCITMLLLALFWEPLRSYELTFEILICGGALLVVMQAWRAQKYFWTTGFIAIAVVFNPIVPLVLTRRIFFLLVLACLGAFLVSLAVLTGKPLAPAPGIINPNRQIQSQFH